MKKNSRRQFLTTTSAIAGVGYFATAGARVGLSRSVLEKLNVASVGVGGKGGSDSSNAAKFGKVVAICDVDRGTLASKGDSDGFKEAERFTD